MTETAEAGRVTGTADKDYNLIWFTETCLSNSLRLETYIEDARRRGDDELVDLFHKAQIHSNEGGKRGKQLLAQRLSK